MKKFMFWAMALAVALVSCQKTETEKAPEITAETLEFTLPAEGTEEEPIYITFNSPVDWTATVSSDAKEWLTISPAKGTAGKASVKVIALSNTESPQERTATVSVTASTAKAEFKLTQFGRNDFTFVDVDQEADIDEKGGTIEIEVMTNVEFKASVYEGSDWLHIVADTKAAYGKQTVKVTVDPYTEYDGERTGEIKFEVSGEVIPDGVAYYSITQNGPSTKIWGIDLSTVMNHVATYNTAAATPEAVKTMASMALFNGDLVVCAGDGSKPVILDKKTGAKKGELSTGDVVPYTITNDDAGNIILSNRVYNYWTTSTFFTIWYMKPGDTTPTKLVSTADSEYYPSYIGYSLSVRGDVTKDAVVVAPWEGGGGYGDNMVLAWDIKGGEVGNYSKVTLTGFIGISWMQGYWSGAPANSPAIALLGTSLSSGFIMGCYDENTPYYVTADGTCTKLTASAIIGSNNNFNNADIRTVGNTMYAVAAADTFFDYATPEVKVMDGASRSVIYTAQTKNYSETMIDNYGADATLEAADGGLNIYYIANNACAIEAFFVPITAVK